MAVWKSLFILGFAGLLLTSCQKSSPPIAAATPPNSDSTNQQTFQVKGVVRELKPDGKTVVIQHEAVTNSVTNYMPAMTMPFEVRDPNELRGLQPGDAISFRMTVTDTDGWIHHITKLSAQSAELPSRPGVFVARDIEPLNVGDPLPNYHFTNQLGQAVNTAQFKGQPLVFTFFFTSCPYPLFCPLLATHFEDTQKQLLASTNAPTQWHLLFISFDTDVDKPEVLKNYADRYHYDPAHWDFVTGDPLQIIGICDQVGEQYDRIPGAGISHNLRTVVVDAAGRIQKIYHNNDWTPDDLIAEIQKAAQVKPAR